MSHRELRPQVSENKLSSREVTQTRGHTDTVNHLIARVNEQDDIIKRFLGFFANIIFCFDPNKES